MAKEARLDRGQYSTYSAALILCQEMVTYSTVVSIPDVLALLRKDPSEVESEWEKEKRYPVSPITNVQLV